MAEECGFEAILGWQLVDLTGLWTSGMTRAAAMRRSTAVQPLVAVNGRFLTNELELPTPSGPSFRPWSDVGLRSTAVIPGD